MSQGQMCPVEDLQQPSMSLRMEERIGNASDRNQSALVPYRKPVCLAHDTTELLRLCHYLHGFGILDASSSEEDFTSTVGIDDEDDASCAPKPESEEWKQRFESLDRLRSQLKNASIEAESINEIIDSLDSEDVGEWINFAAASGGAKIVGANPEARNPIRTIDGKKETFMKSDCRTDQWLIIELSHTSKVKMIGITMKELYSPRIASFNVYGRMATVSKNLTEYPEMFRTSKWHFLTELKPDNRKGTQRFTVISGGLVKYIGIHILKYHGMGTTCTVNDVSVYGLSPANNLESLLEEAVQDDKDNAEQNSSQREETKGGDTTQTETNDKATSANTDPREKQETTEEAVPSLPKLAKLEKLRKQESTWTVETDPKGRGSEEDTVPKRLLKNSESIPSVSTFRKMHQDVQALKGSTTVLSQYVDELHGGLKQTIDELWKAQKTTKADTDQLLEQFNDVHVRFRRLEDRMDTAETEQKETVRRSQITMGVMGFCVSFIGLIALQSSSFSHRSALFIFAIYLLCCLNFLISFLNILTVVSPAFLIKLSKLKTRIRPIWKSTLTH